MDQIYLYTDYRKFLTDYFRENKSANPHFSHRYFAQKAGFKTSNFMLLVMSGKRNLTKESLTKIAMALGLKKPEWEYFENLVFFSQAKTLKEKDHYFGLLSNLRKGAYVATIHQDQYEYYSHWIHPVVREAACFRKSPVSEEAIAKMIVPWVSPSEVKKSLELLTRLNFLKKEADGSYTQVSPLITTGPEVRSLAVARFHVSAMTLASESIERFKADEREISGLTLGISEATFQKIKKRIQEFRLEMLSLADEPGPDRVCQLNFQFFPMTRLP